MNAGCLQNVHRTEAEQMGNSCEMIAKECRMDVEQSGTDVEWKQNIFRMDAKWTRNEHETYLLY